MLNAENAASWIANNALLENGAILTRKYLDGENKNFSFDGGNIFAFDTGMVLIGFCNLYKITKKKKISRHLQENYRFYYKYLNG